MPQRTAGFLAYCMAITAILLAVAEFILLPWLLGLPRDTLLMRFAATPGTRIDGQVINRMGFSGDVLEKHKPPNTLRILLLGSSTLFNRHLGEKLQASLQAGTTQRVELLNASLRSHTSRSDLLKYRLLRQYDFDYVLYYNGINDLWANHAAPALYRDDYAHMDAWYAEGPLISHSVLAHAGYRLLRPWLEKLDARRALGWYSHAPFVFPGRENMNAARFASVSSLSGNLRNIQEMVRDDGATLLLMTFAHAIPADYTRRAFLENRLGYVNPDNYDRRDAFNWGPPDYVREGLARINHSIRNLAVQTGTPLLDMDAALSPHIAWFGDPCHFNDEGVDAFVSLVTAHFRQAGWLPAPPQHPE